MLLAALLAAATPQSCTLENARPATVREIAAKPGKWLGRCVRIQGYSEGHVLYQDVAGSYRHDASDKEDRRNDGWLGLEFREKRSYRRPPFKAQVVGRVHDCRADHAAAEARTRPGRIVIAYGSRYCHDHGGLLLRDATIRHGEPAALPRQTGERARLEFGDLLTVQEAGAPPEEPVGLLHRFVAAVRSGDAAAAAALAGSYNRQVRESVAGAAEWRSFIASEGPLAFLRSGPVREPTYFRARMSRHDLLQDDTPHWFACFCATPDCKGKWPVGVKDAAVDADPSYSCVRLYRGSTPAKSWAIGIDTRKPWGFAERD
jgi:hypothetical protein